MRVFFFFKLKFFYYTLDGTKRCNNFEFNILYIMRYPVERNYRAIKDNGLN